MSNWACGPISKAYYWHGFFSLRQIFNYDKPCGSAQRWACHEVLEEMALTPSRIDAVAVPYLGNVGTNCENLPEDP